MRIAYLSFENPQDQTGVGKKITAQISAWAGQGHEVQHFSLRRSSRFRNPTLSLFLKHREILKELRRYSPDIIYMREILFFPGFRDMIRVCPAVLEINSDSVAEYKSISSTKYLYHLLFRRYLFSSYTGYVSVSQELKDKLLPHADAPVLVMGNGYDYATAAVLPPSLNDTPHFLIVASPGQKWTGLDRLYDLAEKLPDCHFHVVSAGYKSPLPNIHAHGALYGAELREVYQKCDIGLGSMALKENNMREASPLKTREYLALGLPVVLPYHDTDLHEWTSEMGVLNLPEGVEGKSQEIRRFAYQWLGKRLNHDATSPVLSTAVKERERLVFMQRVIHE